MVDWKVTVDDRQLTRMTNEFIRETRAEARAETRIRAQKMASELKNNAPDDTGELQSSIQVFGTRDGDTFGNGVSVGGSNESADAFYGRFVEFGYRRKDGTIVPADPFFYPLVRKHNRLMKLAMRRAMKRIYARFS